MTASSSGNGSHLGNFMIDWTLVPIACERYVSFHIDVHEGTCVWVLFFANVKKMPLWNMHCVLADAPKGRVL